MNKILFLIVAVCIGYYIYEYHTPYGNQVIDPYYLEVRIKIEGTSVQMVGFGEMNSLHDCETRGRETWQKKFKKIGSVKATKECKKTIPKKYQRMFDNKKMNASYIAFDKGNKYERSGRFLFYGVPSSLLKQECSKIIKHMRADNEYKGKVYCIKGKVG